MVKKKIIFVIDSLNCAGAEKSLTTLLSLLDYSKYEEIIAEMKEEK